MVERASLLLITPDADECRRLRECLEAGGHRVHLSADTAALIAETNRVRAEVVVIDAFTHPAACLAAIHQAKVHEPHWEAYILALVAEDDPEAAGRAIEAGADDWLGWPARPRELLSRVAIHVRIRRLHEVLGARLVENRALARQRDQVLSMLTHDMKAPLTVILGTLRLFEDGKFGPLPGEDARQAISGATRSANRLVSYIDDFLTLSSTLVGTASMEQEPVDIRTLLERLASDHGGAAAGEGVTLTLDLRGDLGEVTGDEDHLTRAVENLLGNALKFTPEGGRVTLGAEGDTDEVRLWVEDNGPGIPRDEQPMIFDPFHRGHGAERVARGAGLGLSVVRTIVEAHGGTVEVRSEEGQGARFTARLPRQPGRSHRRTALIIEDNTDFARILSLSLQLEGVDSIICTTAEEALGVLQRSRPDLITLDLMLPGMQGRQFLEDLSRRMGETGAPVLALSASERRLEALGDIPMVRIRMTKDAFDQNTFRQAARELLSEAEGVQS